MTSFAEFSGWRTFFGSLTGFLTSWESFFGSILEGWSEWSRTRHWLLVGSTAPLAIALVSIVVGVGFFRLQSAEGISQSLVNKVDRTLGLDAVLKSSMDAHLMRNGLKGKIKEIPQLSDSESVTEMDSPASKSSKLLEEVDLLLERAQQISPDNSQIKFRKAVVAAQRGNYELADTLMKELTKKEITILGPAHAWSAISMLGSKTNSKVGDQEELEQHLQHAAEWKGVDPVLLTIYSTMLLRGGKSDKAIEMAKEAAKIRPELNLPYAQILRYAGPTQAKEMLRAAKAAEEAYRSKLGTPIELEGDRIACANAILMTDRLDVALELLREGMGTDDAPRLEVRRFLSDLLVREFRKANVGLLAVASVDKAKPETASPDASKSDASGEVKPSEPKKTEIDWSRLLEASEVDPDNPSIGHEVAFQVRSRQKTPTELNDVLLRQLKSGKASTSTLLLVAERYLERGKLPEARSLWEQILEKDPYCLPAMNNLSVMISRDQPPNTKRALELIDRAYRAFPMNAELCDSYGEIYMNLGRSMDAVTKYEEAIKIDPSRIGSRIRLAQCYRDTGLDDVAAQQDRIVKELQVAAERGKVEAEKKPSAIEENKKSPNENALPTSPASTSK
jgi:tetratricopeptide (TPR) repeat protein